MSMIINEVQGLIKGAIKRFARENECEPEKIGLLISAIDEEGNPRLTLTVSGKTVKELRWDDLCSLIEKMKYKTFGFDINTQMPIWIKKFLLKAVVDVKMNSVLDAFYMIFLRGDELRPMMYYNGVCVKELPKIMIDKYANVISIDYILKTE